VGAANEGGADDAVGDDVDLPDRCPAEEVALDDDVANDKHRQGKKKGREHSCDTRQKAHDPDVGVHAAYLRSEILCGIRPAKAGRMRIRPAAAVGAISPRALRRSISDRWGHPWRISRRSFSSPIR